MICIEEQKENIARLNKIQSAAQVDAVIGIFQFFGQGWRLAAGVEFDSDEWEIADYPALMAGWDALVRVYQTAGEILNSEELESLREYFDESCSDLRGHGIPVELPTEPVRLKVAA